MANEPTRNRKFQLWGRVGLFAVAFGVLALIVFVGFGSSNRAVNDTKPVSPGHSPLAPIPPAVRVYAQEIYRYLKPLGNEAGEMAYLFGLLDQNEGLINSVEWRTDVSQRLVNMQHLSSSIGTIQPVPPDLRAVDSHLKRMSMQIPLLSLNLEYGLQNRDEREFAAAIARLEEVKNHIEMSRDALGTALLQYPGGRALLSEFTSP